MNEGDTIWWSDSRWQISTLDNGMARLVRTQDKNPPLQSKGDSCWIPTRSLDC